MQDNVQKENQAGSLQAKSPSPLFLLITTFKKKKGGGKKNQKVILGLMASLYKMNK